MAKDNKTSDKQMDDEDILTDDKPESNGNAETGEVRKLDIKESAEYKELQDRYLRLAAEFDNYKKRNAREYTQMREWAASDLILDLLHIADDFRRALQHDSEDVENYKQGMKLIYGKLLEVLQKKGVKEIDAVGKQFDPNFHEAILQVEVDDQDDGIIVEEVEKGYFLNDRVLRPARVVVAKRKETDSDGLEYSDSDNE